MLVLINLAFIHSFQSSGSVDLWIWRNVKLVQAVEERTYSAQSHSISRACHLAPIERHASPTSPSSSQRWARGLWAHQWDWICWRGGLVHLWIAYDDWHACSVYSCLSWFWPFGWQCCNVQWDPWKHVLMWKPFFLIGEVDIVLEIHQFFVSNLVNKR